MNNNTLYSYHGYDRTNWHFLTKGGEQVNAYCNKVIYKGIELEIEPSTSNYRTNTAVQKIYELMNNNIYCSTDGSLCSGGIEIVSFPFSEEKQNDMFEDYKNTMNYLQSNGYRSHDGGRCGLHIHFTRPFEKDSDEDKAFLNKLYFIFESFKEDIKALSRRANYNYCQYFSDYIGRGEKDVRYYKSIYGLSKTEKRGGHSTAINNDNTNTIEIRILRGTLNYETFKTSIEIITNLFNLAFLDIKDLNNITFKKVLKTKEQKAYAINRGCDLTSKMFDYSKIIQKIERQTITILLKSNKIMSKITAILFENMQKSKIKYEKNTDKLETASNYMSRLYKMLDKINDINSYQTRINNYINNVSDCYSYNELLDYVRSIATYETDNEDIKQLQKELLTLTSKEL